MAFRAASTLFLLTLAAADQCNVKHNTTYSNCWGADLHGERADSFETCCQRCAEIPQCEVFTFDKWNVSGDAEPYCFFKYGCNESRHSDTAISGILQHRPSTEKTTKAPKTTCAPTTAPVTTEAPVRSTTPAGAGQPQCTAPSPVAGVGLFNATKQLNVSSWDDCCSSCAAPACSYVTFGKYSHASEETWACFHFSEPAEVKMAARLFGSGELLMLRDDEEAASCKDLGLEGCRASLVSTSPGRFPGPAATSPAALGAVGACTFLVTVPIGYVLSRKLVVVGGK